MYKIVSLILFLNNIFVFSQNQNTVQKSNLVCKYQVKFLKDTLDKFNQKDEVMTLLIGDHISLFKSDQKAKSDSLRTSIAKNSISNATGKDNINIDMSKIPRVNMGQEVLSENGKMKVYDKIFKYQFSFEPVNRVKWDLVNEAKKINGYDCRKAIGVYGKRKLIAWYTPEIPVQEGPYTFKGLPGLIIHINDEKETYIFDLVYLKKEKRDIISITNATETTYEKFVKARQDAKDNVITNVGGMMHREMTVDEKNLVTRNANKVNNYLD